MTEEKLAELTDQELLHEAGKIKTSNLMDALIIGVLIGISVYSAFRNGVGLLSFLAFLYLPIAAKNRVRNRKVEDLCRERHLQ